MTRREYIRLLIFALAKAEAVKVQVELGGRSTYDYDSRIKDLKIRLDRILDLQEAEGFQPEPTFPGEAPRLQPLGGNQRNYVGPDGETISVGVKPTPDSVPGLEF